jgi:mannitol/fructose-specific phosphotransferase system IIA component (Ntr-type)
MKLSEILLEKSIVLDVKNIDKWELIKQLTDVLVVSGQIGSDIRDSVFDGLIEREKSMSTGMENGIAIPHCCVNSISETVVSLGISSEGVDFDSIDSNPSRLVILLVTPKNKTKMHIKTLAEIAKLLNRAESRQHILEAKSPEDALRIIRQEEDGEVLK